MRAADIMFKDVKQGTIDLTHATATRELVSPAFLSVLALSTKSSPTASLSLSAVAGLSNAQPCNPFPFIFLASFTASLNAKNTVLPKNNGGSPIPLLL